MALYRRYFHCTKRQRRCLREFINEADGYRVSNGGTKDDREQRLAVLKKLAIAFS